MLVENVFSSDVSGYDYTSGNAEGCVKKGLVGISFLL